MVNTKKSNFRDNTAQLKPQSFKTIAIDAVNDPDPQQKIMHTIEQHDTDNCVVKVIYSINPENSTLINKEKIREKLSKTTFCSITSVLVQNPSRTNLPEIDATYHKSPLKALGKYLEQRPDLDKESLLTKAKLLLEESAR